MSFPVTYAAFAGLANADLKGKGVLTVQGDRYVFSGRRNRLFNGRELELAFTAADISNVAVTGNKVEFSHRTMPSGRQGVPFRFWCRDPEAARAAAAVLPATQDADHALGVQYHTQLQRVSAGAPAGLVTNVIIALNVLVFVVMAGALNAGWFEVTNLSPYIHYGANNGAATQDGGWWRLLTCMFMHYGLMHVALNMWALYQVGRLVEALQGRVLYAFTYLASGIGGGLLSIDWHGDKLWSVGASGAIFGVYGCLLGHMWRQKDVVPKAVFQPIIKSTLTFAGYNLIYGFINPTIDNAAHIGGLATGLALGWLAAMPTEREARARALPGKLGLAVVVTAGMFAVAIAVAPRPQYGFRDELHWEEGMADLVKQEQTLLPPFNREFNQWRAHGNNGPALATMIGGQLIPFYERFATTAADLALKPGGTLDRRRADLLRVLKFKLEGLAHLERNLQTGAASELAAYERDEREASAVLAAIKGAK